jgi:hypothetical protein
MLARFVVAVSSGGGAAHRVSGCRPPQWQPSNHAAITFVGGERSNRLRRRVAAVDIDSMTLGLDLGDFAASRIGRLGGVAGAHGARG